MTIRLGLMGCGAPAQAYLTTLAETPELRAVAIAELGHADAQAVARKWSLDLVEDTAALPARADVDALLITAPLPQRGRLALAALAAGKPVLLAAPMAATTQDSRAIVDAVEQHDSRLMVGATARYAPIHRAIHDAGRQVGARAYLHLIAHLPATPSDNASDAWTGPLAEALDLALWLLNQGPASIYVQEQRQEPYGELRVVLQGEQGALALLELNRILPADSAPLRSIELIGDTGRAHHADQEDGLLLSGQGLEPVGAPFDHARRLELAAFGAWVQGAAPSPISAQEGHRVVAAMAAVQAARAGGKPVRMAPTGATAGGAA